jgi:hypothetical protein
MEPTLSRNMRFYFEKKQFDVPDVEIAAMTAAHEALMTVHPLKKGRLYRIGTKIAVARQWNRIVVGAHGPYVEFLNYQDFYKQLVIPEDQLWRVEDKRYNKKVKYAWYAPKNLPDLKVYAQTKAVSYADYVPGCYYVDLYEVTNG